MEYLPEDTVFVIFQFLSRKELFFVSQLSKKWEISELARTDRIWESHYIALKWDYPPESLTSKFRKLHDSKSSFFGKYKVLLKYRDKILGYVYSEKIKCWVEKSREYILHDDNLQKEILNRDIKIVVIGDALVGKTCVLIRYCQRKFHSKYLPTIMDDVVAKCRFHEQTIGLNLWDTAGQEDYDTLRPLSYQDTDVFVFTYDISNPLSLERVRTKWMLEANEYSPSSAKVLCCNKIDLRKDKMFLKKIKKEKDQMFTSVSEGLKVARELKANIFLETSAKSGENCTGGGVGFENAILLSFIMNKLPKKLDQRGGEGKPKGGNSSKCFIM